jgi:hypothetical protein
VYEDPFIIIFLDILKVSFIALKDLVEGRRMGMYVKLYNMEPTIKSTLVLRRPSKEGFDLFMPLIYKNTCIPYKSSPIKGPSTSRSEPLSKF